MSVVHQKRDKTVKCSECKHINIPTVMSLIFSYDLNTVCKFLQITIMFVFGLVWKNLWGSSREPSSSSASLPDCSSSR